MTASYQASDESDSPPAFPYGYEQSRPIVVTLNAVFFPKQSLTCNQLGIAMLEAGARYNRLFRGAGLGTWRAIARD
jgi:hypothetical protein